jgi:creatinine amidohydrolase
MAETASEVRYLYLRPAEVVRRRKELALAWLPLGVIEWHGLHNPLGVDVVKTEAALVEMARRIGGLVMPPLSWGDYRREIAENCFDPEYLPWFAEQHLPDQTKTIERVMGVPVEKLRREAERMKRLGEWTVWKSMTVEILFEIESLGFRCIAGYCGHGPLNGPFAETVAAYGEAGGTCEVVSVDFPSGEDHAALRETSLMLALCPGLSDLGELEASGKRTIGTVGEDPLKATAELGRQMVDEFESESRRRLGEKWAGFSAAGAKGTVG